MLSYINIRQLDVALASCITASTANFVSRRLTPQKIVRVSNLDKRQELLQFHVKQKSLKNSTKFVPLYFPNKYTKQNHVNEIDRFCAVFTIYCGLSLIKNYCQCD